METQLTPLELDLSLENQDAQTRYKERSFSTILRDVRANIHRQFLVTMGVLVLNTMIVGTGVYWIANKKDSTITTHDAIVVDKSGRVLAVGAAMAASGYHPYEIYTLSDEHLSALVTIAITSDDAETVYHLTYAGHVRHIRSKTLELVSHSGERLYMFHDATSWQLVDSDGAVLLFSNAPIESSEVQRQESPFPNGMLYLSNTVNRLMHSTPKSEYADRRFNLPLSSHNVTDGIATYLCRLLVSRIDVNGSESVLHFRDGNKRPWSSAVPLPPLPRCAGGDMVMLDKPANEYARIVLLCRVCGRGGGSAAAAAAALSPFGGLEKK